jgi:hypothetical protein
VRNLQKHIEKVRSHPSLLEAVNGQSSYLGNGGGAMMLMKPTKVDCR